MVTAFQKVNNIKIPVIYGDRRPGDIDISYASVEKAKKLLNWEAKYNIEDMCRDSWNWQKNNPNGY